MGEWAEIDTDGHLTWMRKCKPSLSTFPEVAEAVHVTSPSIAAPEMPDENAGLIRRAATRPYSYRRSEPHCGSMVARVVPLHGVHW